MEFFPLNENTVLINFEHKISYEIHEKVNETYSALDNKPGIEFLIPAYSSITVGFQPDKTTIQEIRSWCKSTDSEKGTPKSVREVKIPVCYDECFALDQSEVEGQLGISFKKIVELHSSREYRVFMIGFIVGFPYLGILPESLKCRRKNEVRAKVPKQSVALAGLQTGIYPGESPGGWQIIGKTPVPMILDSLESPSFLKQGDHVRFERISLFEFEKIEDEILNHQFDFSSLYASH